MFTAVSSFGKDKISLSDYGWKTAKTGAQKAKVLYDAQTAALKSGTHVDYTGVAAIDIEITADFKSIPLTGQDDFGGIVFNVTNKTKDVALFKCVRKSKTINLTKRQIDAASFSSFPELQDGEKLIAIQDQNSWVDNRIGYNYGHTRKDILLLRSGRALNKVVAPYNNTQSDPICVYYEVAPDGFFVKGFTLNRLESSTFKTLCLDIQGVAHISLSDITINTPKGELTGDYAIRIRDCADVTLSDITINGTYSKSNKYGYGINFNNTWNTKFIRLRGTAEWGMMGNNNMSDTYLQDCSINRFDIHCYGRNVSLADCVIDGGQRGWYCGGSSIFGTIQYDRCTFKNCVPIVYGDSYKVAVGANVILNDCAFYASKKQNAIFSTKVLNVAENSRQGLGQKSLPNIEINRMTIYVPKGVDHIYLYNVGENIKYAGRVGFMKKIQIHGLKFECESPDGDLAFDLFSAPVVTDKNQSVEISGLEAPNVTLSPTVTSNKRNKIKMRDSSIKPIKRSASNVKLRMNNCNISK